MRVYLLFCTPWVWINLLIVQANLGKKETEVDLLGSAAASVLSLLAVYFTAGILFAM
jgi:hypothetical protein